MPPTSLHHKRVILYVLVSLWLALVAHPAQAQLAGWSRPVRIAQTDGRLDESSSAVVADAYGVLHLFYPEQPKSMTGAINYMHWEANEWTQPIDIIVDPEADQPAYIRAALDGHDTFHLIWLGSGNALRYAQAPLSTAGSAHAWSKPISLANAIGESDLIAAQEALYLAYSDATNPGSLSVITSTNEGESWSMPTVAAISSPGSMASDVRLARDGRGRLHLTWTEYQLPDGWPPTGAYYARSTDGGRNWEPPRQMAGFRHGQIAVATVGDDEVHLVWRSTVGGDGTFHQVSIDGGDNWNPAIQTKDGGGFSGLPYFGVDRLGRLHYVIGPALYAMWDNGQLSPYEDVATLPVRAEARTSGGERGMLSVTSGNRIHVIFEIDFKSLWYTSLLLDAPPLPTPNRPSATPAPAPPTEVSATLVSTPTPTTRIVAPVSITAPPDVDRSSAALASATLSAIVTIALVGVLAINLRRRR